MLISMNFILKRVKKGLGLAKHHVLQVVRVKEASLLFTHTVFPPLTDERMRKVTWLVWEQGIFTWALKNQELTLSVWDGVSRIPTPDL